MKANPTKGLTLSFIKALLQESTVTIIMGEAHTCKSIAKVALCFDQLNKGEFRSSNENK